MHDLRGCRIAELEPGRDVSQRATFDRGLPQSHPLAQRQLSQHAIHEITINDPAFEIVTHVPVGTEGHQRPPEPLPPAEQVQAMILGDRQQSGARSFVIGLRRQ